MVVATSMPDPYDEGYPPSSEADLDPGPDLRESLDEADRGVRDEQRSMRESRGHEALTDDEDRIEDTDDAESRH
jgi:hypothetical protein